MRQHGYSLDVEEETIGSRCIGAPIRNEMGRIVAAVSVAGYKQQIHNETLNLLISRVKKTAAEISQSLIKETEISDS